MRNTDLTDGTDNHGFFLVKDKQSMCLPSVIIRFIRQIRVPNKHIYASHFFSTA